MRSFGKGYNRILFAFLTALTLCLLFAACAKEVPAPSAEPVPSPPPTADPLLKQDAEELRLAELRSKNRAVRREEDGDVFDWSERDNCSDRAEGLHTNFSLSAGETLYLYNSHGYLVSTAPCGDGTADTSMAMGEDGGYVPSRCPTPGYPNTNEGFEAWQESQEAEGPLVINEVVVSIWWARATGWRSATSPMCPWSSRTTACPTIIWITASGSCRPSRCSRGAAI